MAAAASAVPIAHMLPVVEPLPSQPQSLPVNLRGSIGAQSWFKEPSDTESSPESGDENNRGTETKKLIRRHKSGDLPVSKSPKML